MRKIADTGLLKAALDADDQHHVWGVRELRKHAPFLTCEAVLVELAFLLGTGRPGLLLVERGDLLLDFAMAKEHRRLLELLNKYQDRAMDLADACIVRMAECAARPKVWTVDRADFGIYRRNGGRVIPCEFPPRTREES
jgi:predicted nucleic acid-binding protein